MLSVQIYKSLPERFSKFLLPRSSVSCKLTDELKVKIEGSKITVELYQDNILEYQQSEILKVRPLGRCVKIAFLVYSNNGYFYTLETYLKI